MRIKFYSRGWAVRWANQGLVTTSYPINQSEEYPYWTAHYTENKKCVFIEIKKTIDLDTLC